jgi:hypothetical protein
MKTILQRLLPLIAASMLFACGGGGGGSGGNATPPTPTTKIIKISTQGTMPSGALIGGVSVTAILPDGVTVSASSDPQNPAVQVTNAGVVVSSGVAAASSSVLATYTMATATAAGKVNIQLAQSSGFTVGEFVTVNCDVAAGKTVTAANFSLSNFSAVDLNGTPLGGLSAVVLP